MGIYIQQTGLRTIVLLLRRTGSRCRQIGLVASCGLLVLSGCKPKSDHGSHASAGGGYFRTPFQTESEFVVGAVVTDLAEQMYFAANHRLPGQNDFSVTVAEKPGTPLDAPVFELHVRMDSKHKELTSDLAVSGPIWSPEVYQGVAADLARIVGLAPAPAEIADDTGLLAKLMDSEAATIEKADLGLSAALEQDFGNAGLHEQAALLLGAFLLRDHSGDFFEIRTPLSRMTAHLTMAHYLNAGGGVNGRLAQAILLTLVGDEAPALTQLDGMGTNAAVLPMVRVLRSRNTGDYRPLDQLDSLSPAECVAWFATRSSYVSIERSWTKLSESQQQTIDFVRAANEQGYSVEIGHQLLAVAVPLELREIATVYQLTHGVELPQQELVAALNELPERGFRRDATGLSHVQVIGWGQWALFLQRHLCQAIHENFRFMQYSWGVPDDAKEFAGKCDRRFNGLRLYPFVRRFDCTDVAAYHQSVDDGFQVTVSSPQLVPATCWDYLCHKPSFAPPYNPNPNPHVNEWHNHNPLPGTVYDLYPRLVHPSLTDRPDAVAFFEKLHALAPYDCRVSEVLVDDKYGGKPSYDQATALFQAELPYSLTALKTIASTVVNEPDRYEKLMLQAAQLDPACYYDLAYKAIARANDDLAAKYLDQAAAGDSDSVRVANQSVWRVRYCIQHGQMAKARQIAEFGGEVYSASGLHAEGIYHEAILDYDGAFQWYAKNEERYDDASLLIDFCQRYHATTGSSRFDAELKKRLGKIFPDGMKNVSLGDFHAPPTDGVVFQEQSELMTQAGLSSGDVIVAVYGIRVHSERQYMLGRGLRSTPELDLIVWHHGAYREVKASPPNHLFGVQIATYQP